MLTIAQRFASAVQHHEAGRLEEAAAQYRAILQEAPDHAHALHLLGVLAHQAGRNEEAVELISRALTIQGPHPVFHSNLGAVYLATGQLAEAEAHSREALRGKPDLADAHNNLGVALRRQGRLEEAVNAFREALRHNPRHVDARANLGDALHRQGKPAEALARLEETVRLAPTHAQAQNDLGGVLFSLGRPAQALPHLREAIRLRPAFAEAHSNLGQVLRSLNQEGAALASFQEALHINPGNAVTHCHLGYSLEIVGKIEEALAEYREALRLEPENAIALASVSKLAVAGHCSLSDEDRRRLEELAARADLPRGADATPLSVEDSCRVHFALAESLDKAGACDEAFAHYRRGNEILKEFEGARGAAFDLAAERRFVDRLCATFTPAYFERAASFGLDSELPIFIVGMMRSGTTLAEQILASHPQVHGAGELLDLGMIIGTMARRLATDYPECMSRLDVATARPLGEEYLQSLRRHGGASVRVVDKLPANFLHLGVCATLFPRARIIHCRRDPVDTCLSCYFQNFRNPPAYTLDLRHLGQYYREYERLMGHWAKVLPVPVFELNYEQLTADQEATSRRLIAFCGLNWDDRCLRFHTTQRPVRTASTLQVRRPMYRSSVARWKRYQAHLQPLFDELNLHA